MAKCRRCKRECPKNPEKRSSRYFCSDKCYLLKNTRFTSTCWFSQTCIRKDGYSSLRKESKEILAHRLSYQFFKGEIPEGKLVCHICDVRNCINPDHLYLGDDSTNAIDRQNRNKSCSQLGEKNHRSLLTPQHIQDIRKMLEKGYKGSVLAKYFGISPTCISGIKTKRLWSHI